VTARILGALTAPTVDEVVFRDGGNRLVIEAARSMQGFASGSFADPPIAASFDPAGFQAPSVSMVGFAYTQFALPVRAQPGDRFDFNPAENLVSPSAVMPLLLSSTDGRVELLAPLNAWHEQVIAVDSLDGPHAMAFRWGWHGDLDAVDQGFRADIGIFTGHSTREVFAAWGDAIRLEARTVRPPAEADALLTHLSYWTDNGAAYWYRTEPGTDLTSTLRTKLDELDTLGVPVTSVELDSWFYAHEISRPVAEIGYLSEVPPTGMLSWAPRADVLPNGVEALRGELRDRPLVLHSRHISPKSPYLDDGDWWLDRAAHPVDQAFFRRWFDDAKRWGATCIEQDWMMVSFFGNRDMRSVPGRAMAWQRALDDSASATGLNLLWCMALPGDISATVELSNVIAIRTSDDYRYAEDAALLWVWYLTVNRMADALDLRVFKDCFFSSSDPGDSAIDGDIHAELEALLAAMSGGVVGVGDRIGRTDAGVLSRVCRSDGRLVGPDRPISLTDRSFVDAGLGGDAACWASTDSGDWIYLVAINTSVERVSIADRFDLAELGLGERLVYDWRRGTAEVADTVAVELEARDWALFVICPIMRTDGEPDTALIGDPSCYATMGRSRVDHVTGDLLLADGEVVGNELAPQACRWTSGVGLSGSAK